MAFPIFLIAVEFRVFLQVLLLKNQHEKCCRLSLTGRSDQHPVTLIRKNLQFTKESIEGNTPILEVAVCSTHSKYLSLIPISNNSQSNHRLIALHCYLQHISLRVCLLTYADTHTHTRNTQHCNSERLSVEFCFWNKLQFIRILNIPWRHLKSTSQIQGAYYTTLLSNHTSHRDFHS